MITKMGVSELRVPAKALSMPSSATQNKKAGSRLPITPDMKIMSILFLGTSLNDLNAHGNKTIPAETMRNAATW